MQTIQRKIPEIPGAKLNGKKHPGNFSKIWVYLARLSSFLGIWEMLFLSLQLEVAENSNQTFWLNGKYQIEILEKQI